MTPFFRGCTFSKISLALCAFVASPAEAEVSLPAIFSDHMVLQSDMAVPIWGWAQAGEEVTVSIGAESWSTRADGAGKWKLSLGKLSAGEPTTLSVKGRNSLLIKDVLIGEVWLCAGESNMFMQVNNANSADQERSTANFPQIRMFTVQSGAAVEPEERGKGQWKVCDPGNVGEFSATGYFFGRELHNALSGRAIGLINASQNSSPIEAWTSLEAMHDKAALKPLFKRWEDDVATYLNPETVAKFDADTLAWNEAVEKAKAEDKSAPRAPGRNGRPRWANNHPGNLFNGKIAPLVPYAIRGAIWYQGESNVGDGMLYREQLPMLINDWRAHWGQGDFPFAWVQLANFLKPSTEPVEFSGWALTRDSMRKTLALPKTGMTINTDIGDERDARPKNKQEIGRRLALWALSTVYGQDRPWSGPLYDKLEIKSGHIGLSFTHTDGGLVAKGGDLKGFAIAGADRKWTWASARIEGDKVWLTNDEIKEPVAVRYSWANNPDGTLCNGAGMPASPFRTDNW